MALADLQRLRITTPREHSPASSRWLVIGWCAASFVVGFVAARVTHRLAARNGVKVATAVVKPYSGAETKQFTAGGWIEVAAPQYPIHIVARLSERLEELRVHQGQTVQSGEVLARLFDKDQRAHLDVVRANYAAAQTNYAKLAAGYRAQDVETAQARAHETAEHLDLAAARFTRCSNLWHQQVISKDEFDNAGALHRAALATHQAAMAELDKMKAGFRPEEVSEAKAVVDRLAAEVELAQRSMTYCTLTAPEHERPLRVLKTYRSVGQWINAEKEDMPTIVSLYDPALMQMRVDVAQPTVRFVTVGAPVTVVTEANRNRQYKGTVLRIEPLADIAKNTVTVRVKIEDPDDLLFPEMVAQATFLCAAQTNVTAKGVAVPAEAIVPHEGGAHVFVVERSRACRRDIAIEQVGGGQSAVTEGVRSGQRVVLNPGSVRDGQDVIEE